MKQQKLMTREQYLKKFSRAVRWRLPPRESEDAITDYRELVFQEDRDDGKLVEELGEPVRAAYLLTDLKTHRRWLKLFAMLAFGLFLLAKWAWTGFAATTGFFSYSHVWYPVWVMAVGMPLSLYWFRRHGQKNGPMSKWLMLALAVVFACGVGVLAWNWYVMDPQVLKNLVVQYTSGITWQVVLTRELLIEGSVGCALIALIGLVLAKCYDRRWLALYTLCLTLAAMFVFVEFNWLNMDLSSAPDVIQVYLFSRILPVGVVGLVGTGVALC